ARVPVRADVRGPVVDARRRADRGGRLADQRGDGRYRRTVDADAPRAGARPAAAAATGTGTGAGTLAAGARGGRPAPAAADARTRARGLPGAAPAGGPGLRPRTGAGRAGKGRS